MELSFAGGAGGGRSYPLSPPSPQKVSEVLVHTRDHTAAAHLVILVRRRCAFLSHLGRFKFH